MIYIFSQLLCILNSKHNQIHFWNPTFCHDEYLISWPCLSPSQNRVSQGKPRLLHGHTFPSYKQQLSALHLKPSYGVDFIPFCCCHITFQQLEPTGQADCVAVRDYIWCYCLCVYHSYHTHPVLRAVLCETTETTPQKSNVSWMPRKLAEFSSHLILPKLFYGNITINTLSFSV